ncbi:cache domain-containing protein [Stutzerimonas azotifigens]|uniref:cache domain-containing protein n=1 Tax=Stutzerimonas azotifigens TaxID=291995 RepID=UPI0003FD8B59|nr:cache domain-containing protein [Stutzerimonas azotifigens]
MQLRHKIVALSVLPLLIAVAAVCVLVIVQNQRLGEQQARLIESSILAGKRAELEHYVQMAGSLVAPLYDSGLDDAETRRQVLAVLARMSAGRDGYFFVYDRNGRNLMHPRQAELVGQDLWNMTDPDGLPVIQALLKAAGGGGGFQRYAWLKPSTGRVTDKLAYVVMLERWGWMYGTGIYLDDVQAVVDRLRHETDRGVQDTMVAIASLVLVAVLLVFAGGVTLNLSEHRLADRKLQQLNQRLVSLQEEERARVARELHDGLSQLLASVKFQFELAGHQLEEGDARGAATLEQGTERLTAAIGEVRRISHALHPSLLDMLGFPAAVSQLVEEFRQRSALTVDYRMDIGETRLEAGTALALFRILQEALGNIERHAHATRVRVSVERLGAAVRLRVGDDGVGFDPQRAERSGCGIGLRNIRERVEHFGGRFEVGSRPGATVIEVSLPVTGEAPAKDGPAARAWEEEKA